MTPAPDDTASKSDDPFAEYDDFDTEVQENGRIGYSRYGKLSSIGLALVILIGLVAVAVVNIVQKDDDDPGLTISAATAAVDPDRPAPDFSLTLFDGTTFSLADQRGKVVVVNFWASWCGPCKDEMPAIQSIAATSPEDVVFVGVGAKSDKDDDARAFAKEYGVTYGIGRDTEGGNNLGGAIERAFGIPGYPSTIVIDAKGNISTIRIGPVTSGELEQYIAAARS